MGMARTVLHFPTDALSAALAPPKPARRVSRPRRTWRLGPLGFAYAAALADVLAILLASLVTVGLHGLMTVGAVTGLPTGLTVGLIVAVLVTLVGVHNRGYAPQNYFSLSGQVSRAFGLWNSATLAALALAVATRAASDFPRASLAVFYVLGFVCIVGARRGVVHGVKALRARGLASPRRAAVVGFEQNINELQPAGAVGDDSAEFVCTFALREAEAFFADDLSLAVAAIRLHRPDDVFVALPWSRSDLIESSLAALMELPVEVHLGLGGSLRLPTSEIRRVGAVSGLTVTRPPLGVLQKMEKRIFDILVSSLALVLLSPALAMVSLLIRLDSPGPVLFRQKRYGVNQEPFRIYKFRTMRTMDDGAIVKQATRADARITKIGAHLRRLSIDELPQLINVLIGEMSIVGPRPHALAHDQLYDDKLARYARRHNVKPGITGWAQVHGHRGEIADDSAMLARLEHDLYYIDNWSLWLDIKIVWRTVFSRKAHANAY
jgi:Undecaprenyl-phosphate glucose phosphotransferase